MNLFKDFIENKEYFPKKEIIETQPKMMGKIDLSNPRDYFYLEHIQAVVERIEKESGSSLEKAIGPEDSLIRQPAVYCPVNFYEVIEVNQDSLKGKQLFTNLKKELIILKGLENPEIGNIVSGHWNYLLEVVDHLPGVSKYLQKAKDHLELIRSIIKKQNENTHIRK